ncbi:MAG: hypothetical protein CSB16_01825 [Clostridiales bacterium]|nr:MAG: hypothetical protein CSB16_01825 [Clostridiales bacterium]
MKKISIIGGGTGISTILRGLKYEYEDINAIVNVVDDGGSSGVIRSEYDIIPPGDLRNCVIALSNTTPIIERLFSYRFIRGSFEGHSLGNMMITALSEITGSMENALGEAASIFNIAGKVFAVTLENIKLIAYLENGSKVIGESDIPREVIKSGSKIKRVNLFPRRPKAYKKVVEVLENSDVIIVGPGSLYTSLLPALLVSGVKEAILRSNAKVIYISNLMEQPGETTHYSVKDHIESIYEHIEDNIFDYVIVNNSKIGERTLSEYRKTGSDQILFSDEDIEYLKDKKIEYFEGNYTKIIDNKIRHNEEEVVNTIKRITGDD